MERISFGLSWQQSLSFNDAASGMSYKLDTRFKKGRVFDVF